MLTNMAHLTMKSEIYLFIFVDYIKMEYFCNILIFFYKQFKILIWPLSEQVG